MQGECKKASLLDLLPSRSHFYAKSVEMEVVYGLLSLPMNSSLFLPRIRRIRRISPVVGVRQKHKKPLAVDARCLLRAIDAVPV